MALDHHPPLLGDGRLGAIEHGRELDAIRQLEQHAGVPLLVVRARGVLALRVLAKAALGAALLAGPVRGAGDAEVQAVLAVVLVLGGLAPYAPLVAVVAGAGDASELAWFGLRGWLLKAWWWCLCEGRHECGWRRLVHLGWAIGG